MTSVMTGRDEIRVVRALLPHDGPSIDDAWGILSTDERERLSSVAHARERGVRVQTRALLRRSLAAVLSCAPSEVPIGLTADRQPVLVGPAADSGVRFSVSHSAAVALVAVAVGCEVGIDLERVEAAYDWTKVAPLVCNHAELRAIEGRREADRRRAFYELWVRKEAYLKGRGTGFLRDPLAVTVPSDASGGVVHDALAAANDTSWVVRPLGPVAGFVAALAHNGRADLAVQWDE
jgi:4'-phosphopantetheinyl transferase